MRKTLLAVLLLGWALLGCSRGGSTPFDQRLPADGALQERFEVTEEASYSVALEATVQGLTAQDRSNRDRAWEYLSDTSTSEPIVAEITLVPAAEPGRKIISARVVNPKLSSWSDEVLYMELARAHLGKGTYVVSVAFSGRSLHQPMFVPGVVVQRTFSGK